MKYTDTKGNVKNYDVTAQEESTLLEAIKGAAIPIQSRVFGKKWVCRSLRWKLHLRYLRCADVAGFEWPDFDDRERKWIAQTERKRKGVGSSGFILCSYHLACQSIVTSFMEDETIEINYCRKCIVFWK